jgi:hypothetical protein
VPREAFDPIGGHDPETYQLHRWDPEYIERQERALWKIRSAFPELKIPRYGYRYDEDDEPMLLLVLEALAVVAEAAEQARDYPYCACS